MSKLNITARDHVSRMQNIPLRSDLGAKLRAALREQQPLPRTRMTADFNGLEMKLHAQCTERLKKEGNDDDWNAR